MESVFDTRGLSRLDGGAGALPSPAAGHGRGRALARRRTREALGKRPQIFYGRRARVLVGPIPNLLADLAQKLARRREVTCASLPKTFNQDQVGTAIGYLLPLPLAWRQVRPRALWLLERPARRLHPFVEFQPIFDLRQRASRSDSKGPAPRASSPDGAGHLACRR
jgi:hypothetical protein